MVRLVLETVVISAWFASWVDALVARPRAACASSLPTWAVDDIHISLQDPASANFTLTQTLMNTTEAISCELEFATLCEIRGTPNHEDVYIHLQIKNENVWVNVTSSPFTCDGR